MLVAPDERVPIARFLFLHADTLLPDGGLRRLHEFEGDPLSKPVASCIDLPAMIGDYG